MKFLGGVKWYCGRHGWSYEGSCAAVADNSPKHNESKSASVFMIERIVWDVECRGAVE